MTYNYADKVAIVTGGGSGIGEACVQKLAESGASIIVADVDEENGERVAESVNSKDGNATFIYADVSNPKSVEEMVNKTIETYAQLDIAVNNAGIGGDQSMVGDYSINSWQQVIDINLNGVFYCMRYQIPQMLKQSGGAIVNMASILGTVGFATSSAYVAAKHGVVGLTKSAALEYSAQGVRVNAVGPGFIKTPLLEANLDEETTAMLVERHPIGRMGEADEVADLVTFLCSAQASFITGSYYTIDGAYTAQ